jgi:uncharacterized heparinase superfamily protein
MSNSDRGFLRELTGGLSEVPLYYHTLKDMETQQLIGTAERNARQLILPKLPISFDSRYEQRVPEQPRYNGEAIRENTDRIRQSLNKELRREYREKATEAIDGSIEFTNESLEIGSRESISWDAASIDGQPLMWRLKLTGFEFLPWAFLGYSDESDASDELVQTYDSWLLDWVKYASIDEENYLRHNWIPHAVSLRLLNGIRYLVWRNSEPDSVFSEEFARELYKNALFLRNHVEYDIGGNHLAENATALVIAGAFFDEDSWKEYGCEVLKEVCEEQFLPDGGHFERSPMYHIQVLRRILTVIDLLGEQRETGRLWQTAEKAVSYLRAIRPPDNRIPLLNDAVYCEQWPLEDCLRYAENLGIKPASGSCSESGYYWLGSGPTKLLVDAGDVGPAHLPAHSHNDLLSILFWVDGSPILTDTGTYEYTGTERRRYARSVEAHNTVQVGDQEPIDIGGSYLMGRRTSPESVYLSDGVEYFVGEYRSHPSKREGYRHQRSIYTADDWWFVWDITDGGLDSTAKSRLHLHPDIEIKSRDESASYSLSPAGESEKVWLHIINNPNVETSKSPYFPEFGREIMRDEIVIKSTTEQAFGYVITTSQTQPEVQLNRKIPESMTLDKHYKLPTSYTGITGSDSLN